MFKLSLIKLYTGNANRAEYQQKGCLFMADLWEQNGTLQLVFIWFFHLGVKFSPVPLHVSPSTHLTCLTYALTILNFRRSLGRLSECVCLLPWSLPEHKQQNSDKHKCLFLQLISCFCTSCIVSAAYTTRTCTT